jgi:hypothetical protein
MGLAGEPAPWKLVPAGACILTKNFLQGLDKQRALVIGANGDAEILVNP